VQRPPTWIADAIDVIVAAVAIAAMVLAATGVLTGSTALGLVPSPVGEPSLIPGPATNTTIRLYVADADEALASTGQHQWTAALADMPLNRYRK
jgi:hypothetical protein